MLLIQTYYYFIKNQIKSINHLIWFYIFGIGLYSLTFAYIVSPPRGVDEIAHFFRALQVSQGNFTPTYYKYNSLGGELDAKMTYYVSTMFTNGHRMTYDEKQNFINGLNQLSQNKTTKEIFSSSASYSPVMYIPSATGLFFAKLFHGNVDTRYFAGRLGNVICYVLLLSVIILVLPVGKYSTLILLSTPTSLQMVGSYNADTFANLIVILFVASCLRCQEITTQSDSYQWKITICILAILLGLLKITYCFLSLFSLLVPIYLFKNKKNPFLFYFCVILLSIIPAYIWNKLYPFDPGLFFHQQNDPSFAIHILLIHPLHVLYLIFHTLNLEFYNWYLEIYGRFCNQSLFNISDLSINFLIILFLSILLDKKKNFSYFTPLLCFIISIGYTLIVFLAFYINFSPIVSNTILGLQGRYFIIAIIPITLSLFYVLPQKLAYEKLLPIILVLNFLCLTHVIMKAFLIITN